VRQGQVVVLRELFSFIMGIFLLLSIVLLFNDEVAPGIKKMTVNEKVYSMIFHVNSLLEKTKTLARDINNAEIYFQREMPDKLSGQTYRVYTNSNQLCVRTSGDVILNRCVNMTINASGNYLSGTDIFFNATFKGNDVMLAFDNVLAYAPVCTTS